MLRVLVTGAAGLLGSDVSKVFKKRGYEVIEIKDENDLDLRDADLTVDYISRCDPEVVIHCAGTHDIDFVETHPEQAYENIVSSTRNIVEACKELGCVLLYPGSDYIFDGEKSSPYKEADEPRPVNIYGKAKLSSEKAIMSSLKEYFIIRLPILFGSGGSKEANIIYKTYSLITSGKEVKVPSDQVSSCGYTVDVAEAFTRVLDSRSFGIYHLANGGSCSRYELYKEIASQLSLPAEKVVPCQSAELKRPAKRPKYTVLDTSLAEKTFGIRLRSWKKALEECVIEFRKKYALL
ncbi:MAG: dTDP-4-dehydrorhamnose reductase [Thaumarchaeota archaeon]|nr:dTDP-4-dehydrorhamnose reductase [Nitrososphaerota archaeon]